MSVSAKNRKLIGSSSTVKRKETFLKAAALILGNVSKSAQAANIDRRTLYRWNDEDQGFAARYEDVQESKEFIGQENKY